MTRTVRLLAITSILALLAAACGPGSAVLRSAIDAGRSSAGVDPAIDSPYLDISALIESVNACDRANGGTAPAPTFGGETSAETAYLTYTSPLDDADAAAQDMIDSIPSQVASAMVQPKWDRKGVATYRCPDDGLLYGTAIVSDFVAEPTGRYADEIYTEAQITVHDGLRYGTAPLCEPAGNDLFLDIYEPPVDAVTERPLMVVIHGGGFKSGDRKKNASQAMDYAQRGFVVAAIEYRTCPTTLDTMTGAERIAAITNTIDDGMESVRYLRANAETYGIDIDRVGVVGRSAGAAITYATALLDDPPPGGPLGAFDFRPDAVMGTGAHLTPAIDDPGFVADPPPVMMVRAEFDTVAGPDDPDYEWPYSYETCNEIHAGGGICDFFVTPGTGHVTNMSPDAPYGRWFMPFFYEHLDLANA